MSKARRGIYAAAVSPFDDDGSLNAQKLVRYCQHLLSDGGCDGVAPTGTTGEGTSISTTDRLALPGVFAEAGIETDRVIFGTGAPASGDCVALTRAAVEAGYTNVLVLPPFYYKNPSDEGLYAYFANLVEKIGRDDLRVYLYHFPQMSMTPLSPAFYRRAEGQQRRLRAIPRYRCSDWRRGGRFRCLSLVRSHALGWARDWNGRHHLGVDQCFWRKSASRVAGIGRPGAGCCDGCRSRGAQHGWQLPADGDDEDD